LESPPLWILASSSRTWSATTARIGRAPAEAQQRTTASEYYEY
jgi:hypothetical protein